MADPRITAVKSAEFRKIVEGEVEEFYVASKQFGSPVMESVGLMVRQAFEAEYVFIQDGISRKKPATDFELGRLTEPVFSILRKIQEFRDQHRQDQFNNHLATIAESIAALSWITVPRTPASFIRDMKEAGDYFGNRVLTTFKGHPEHVIWINKWNATLTALERYVKEYHTTGFEWDTLKLNCPEYSHAPPPPPPPPPSHELGLGDGYNIRGQGDPQFEADRQQLLADINQGIEIVNILKPVRGERSAKKSAPSAQPGVHRAQSAARAAQKSPAPVASHPPVFTLEGKKWLIEYQKNMQRIEVNPNDKSESLAMFKCEDTLVETKRKMNAVTIDNCKKCIVVLESIISSVELIRCGSLQVHCMGTCQNVTLDNCDSCQIFLTDRSSNCEVITAKCTSTNICRLEDNGDYVEFPVPEQIRSMFHDDKLYTDVVEHRM